MAFTMLLGQTSAMLTLVFLINGLILPPSKRMIKPILYFHILFCGTLLAIPLGQFSSLPQFFGSLFILSFCEKPLRRWNLILFQLSWFWSVLTDYAIAIPLRLLGLDFDAIRSQPALSILFYMLHGILLLLPARSLNRLLRPRLLEIPPLFPEHFQKLLLISTTVGSCTLLFNIIWGSYSDYPTEILLFNGALFFALALTHLLQYMNLYRTMQENQRLALREQAREKLSEYTAQLENHYQEIRRFKHDYMNLLSTLNGFIQEGDMERLRSFLECQLLPESRLLLDRDSVIARLGNMKVLEVKGVLYTKILVAINANLQVELEISDPIDRVDMNLLTLSRVLGIYLDNAIEAAGQTAEGRLRIALIKDEDRVVFHLANSTPPLALPLEQLYQTGVTTKEGHMGTGLSNVTHLLSLLPNVTVTTSCQDGIFTQILTVYACPEVKAVKSS